METGQKHMKTPLLKASSKELKNALSSLKLEPYKLFIQVTDSSLIYSVLNTLSSCHICLCEYPIPPYKNTYALTGHISEIIKNDEVLSQSFPEAILSIKNKIWTLAPNTAGYDKSAIQILDFEFGKASHQSLNKSIDVIPPLGALNIYGYPTEISSIFKLRHGKLIIKHYVTSLIRGFHQLTDNASGDRLFLDFSSNSLLVALFQGRKLILSNQFECQTFEDFLYFSMITTSEYKIPTETLRIYISGNKPRGLSTIIDTLSSYAYSVNYIDSQKTSKFSPDIGNLKSYKYLSLLSQHLCV